MYLGGIVDDDGTVQRYKELNRGEQAPNNSTATSQEITLPIIINGRIGEPGERDVYSFEGQAGLVIVADVYARRLGSRLDSYLKLTDAEGKMLAFTDDMEDRGQGLMTHHADSRIQTTLPKDGTYFLIIGDTRRQGSPAHAYRLRVSRPQPDSELRITPCSINARGRALRSPSRFTRCAGTGRAAEINLFLTNKPLGFVLEGSKIHAKQNEVRVTVQVPPTPRPNPVHLGVEGRAMIAGKLDMHQLTPAENKLQAFAYHHLVLSHHLLVTVSKGARALFPAQAFPRTAFALTNELNFGRSRRFGLDTTHVGL
jgi:hypothetical protein